MLRLNILKITSPTEDPNVVYEYDELFQKYDLMNEKEISEPKNCALKEMAIPFNVNYNAYDLEKVREILGFKKISENISEWYIDQNFNRYHRFKFARKTIPDNIIKFFDSGNTKYIWHRSEVQES